MYYGAANRDPEVFDRPHELDLRRSPNHHVAFGGGGPHFCLGAHIARIEIDALLRQILSRLEDLSPAGAAQWRSEEHPSELQSLMRISDAVFCLIKKLINNQ